MDQVKGGLKTTGIWVPSRVRNGPLLMDGTGSPFQSFGSHVLGFGVWDLQD